MRFPILTTLMVSALALGTAAHAQQAPDQQHQGMTAQQPAGQQSEIDPRMQDPAQVDFRGLIDRDVIDQAGEQIGEVSDVLVDRDGEVRMIVIEHGGVLGMANRLVAFPVDEIEPIAEGIRIPVAEAQLENMPEWQPADPLWADWTGLRDNGANWAGGAGTATGTETTPGAEQQTQGGQVTPGTTD